MPVPIVLQRADSRSAEPMLFLKIVHDFLQGLLLLLVKLCDDPTFGLPLFARDALLAALGGSVSAVSR